jgi:hypothetical protein
VSGRAQLSKLQAVQLYGTSGSLALPANLQLTNCQLVGIGCLQFRGTGLRNLMVSNTLLPRLLQPLCATKC